VDYLLDICRLDVDNGAGVIHSCKATPIGGLLLVQTEKDIYGGWWISLLSIIDFEIDLHT